MQERAEIPFEDESGSFDEAVVDELILRAGGERPAIRALLVDLAEAKAAISLGYVRGVQPPRPAR